MERVWTGGVFDCTLEGNLERATDLERETRIHAGFLFDQLMSLQTYATGGWREPDGSLIDVQVWRDVLGERVMATIWGAGVGTERMCRYGEPVFLTPAYPQTVPQYAFVGLNCSDQVGRIVLREVTSWDHQFPVADHVTYGDDVAIVLEVPGVEFWWKPHLSAHPTGIGIIVTAMDSNGTLYLVNYNDAHPTVYPATIADLVEQTVIFEGGFANQPRIKIFSNNAIDEGWTEKLGHYLHVGGQFTQDFINSYLYFEFVVMIDEIQWRGVVRTAWGADWPTESYYDCNGDNVIDDDDKFVVSGYPDPLVATMIEVMT
jgi:hypothetical protein